MQRIVVIGASLAGIRAAEALRRRGFDGELTVAGAEPGAPYRRPELSKGYLRGSQSADEIRLSTDAGLDVRPATEGVLLDPGARVVWLRHDGGTPVPQPFDGLVIATGAIARTLPEPRLRGIHTLRTLADAEALRTGLLADPGIRVVVVGGGPVAGEVAAAVRLLGLGVTLVCPAPGPMAGLFGPAVARMLAELHEGNGTACIEGTVARIEGDDRVRAVRLADGTEIPADLVVLGIGARPATGWLHGSGLIEPDGTLRHATNLAVADGITAAGDVTAAPGAGHWDSAVRQADTAARTLLEGPSAPAHHATTMFWTELYGTRLQMLGHPAPEVTARVAEGSLCDHRCVVTYGTNAVLLVNSPHRISAYRRLLSAAAT